MNLKQRLTPLRWSVLRLGIGARSYSKTGQFGDGRESAAVDYVLRHARATRVDVLLERRGDRVVTIVEDDGVGFDLGAAGESGRLGLFGMRERAKMLGGTLVVESTPGTGATVLVEVPYVDSDPDRR